MTANRSQRIGGLLLAVILVGCGQPGASTSSAPSAPGPAAPTGSLEPTAAAVASPEPSTPPTAEPTAGPTEEPAATPVPIDPSCPNDDTTSIISVQEYVDAPTSCFRYGVRVRGWLDGPPPMGFEGPLVKPTWLFYPNGDTATALWHQPPPQPDHVCAVGVECWWFFPHPDPDAGVVFEPLQRWVILTGHTRDPRAQNCHVRRRGRRTRTRITS